MSNKTINRRNVLLGAAGGAMYATLSGVSRMWLRR